MNDTMKIFKSLEESGLFIKDINETVKNKAKEQKGGFLSIVLSALGVSLLENLWASKNTIKAGDGTIRAGQYFLFFIQDIINLNLPGPYVINFDEFTSIRNYWIAFYVNGNNIIYFDSFGVEHIPKEIQTFIGNKNIITSIYRTQANNSLMCKYLCIRFIDFMLKGRRLLDYTR